MRGNLEYFLEHQSQDVATERGTAGMIDSGDRANFAAG
jgi:hypothetical protein